MSQQVQIFSISAGDSAGQEEINRFLRGHRVLTVDRSFADGAWQFCVVWQEGSVAAGHEGRKAKVDYKEVLNEATFALFSRLRETRKSIAEKERLPVYAILTNEQLAEVAKARCDSLDALRRIEGIGEGRLEKFGQQLLEAIKDHEKQPTETGADSRSGKPA